MAEMYRIDFFSTSDFNKHAGRKFYQSEAQYKRRFKKRSLEVDKQNKLTMDLGGRYSLIFIRGYKLENGEWKQIDEYGIKEWYEPNKDKIDVKNKKKKDVYSIGL